MNKNQIIGELITFEKYKFTDGKLIAAIVADTLDLLEAQKDKDVIILRRKIKS